MSDSTVLLLIDVQRDYFEGGAFEMDEVQRERAATTAARLLEAARGAGTPVVHVRHESVHAGATFLLAGTSGTAFDARVAPLEGETVITKHAPNAFFGTDLEERLHALGTKRVVIGGMIAWMCIVSGVRAAAERGFEVVLVPDMVASRAIVWRGRAVSAEDTLAAAIAPLSFFAREATADEAALLLV